MLTCAGRFIGGRLLLLLCLVHLSKAQCLSGSVNFARTSNVRPLDTFLNQLQEKQAISSLKCHQHCIDMPSCTAYLYDGNAFWCYLIFNDTVKINHQNLFRAPNWSFHRRICLSPDSICNQQWAFETYGFTHLNQIADKIVTNLNSEETCLNACSAEKMFVCKSAVYNHVNRTCSLHSNNKKTTSNSFEQNFNSDLLYIENPCVQQGCELWRTHFERNSGTQLINVKPFKLTNNLQPGECLQLCNKDLNCRSININYKRGTCQFFEYIQTPTITENEFKNESLVIKKIDYKFIPNNNVNYFTKVCLTELNSCGTDWTYERFLGKKLEIKPLLNLMDSVYIQEKIFDNINSTENCASLCLASNSWERLDLIEIQIVQQKIEQLPDNFLCRSAEFNRLNKTCVLRSYTQHSAFGKQVNLINASEHFEYLENNCLGVESKSFCNWKTTKEYGFILADQITVEPNLTACKEKCLSTTSFICRSVTYDAQSQTCSLSYHTIYSTIKPTSFNRASKSIYSELSSCFKISMECKSTEMIAHISTNMPFNGRIYSKNKPFKCFLDVRNSLNFSLPIHLNETECGTISHNGNEYMNILVIQGNDQVLTSSDKVVGVKCAYDMSNITGEAYLQINDISFTDRGRSMAKLPDLSLHIMDINGLDRNEVNLGELLKVQIRLSDENTYGIFVKNLIAKDDTGVYNLTLIDQIGCPTQSKMMREVRSLGKDSKFLESYFEAFSFTGSCQLQLEAEVETCLKSCKPVQCQVVTGRSDDDYETVPSFGRKKRDSNVLDTKVLHHKLKVNTKQFETINTQTKVNSFVYNNLIIKSNLSNDQNKFTTLSGSKDYYCFKQNSLARLSLATFAIQLVFLTIGAVLFYKSKPFNDNQKSSF